MTDTDPVDIRHMHHALRLAVRGLGTVAPNPAVGCVIVAKDGHIAGRGWTQKGGRPHAEAVALAQAGPEARGGTVYVTLEPCAHHGQTPPCADALVEARIARVVAAVTDPDPRVNGNGLAILRDAGTEVVLGVCKAEAAALNAGFFLKVRENRPLVTLKIATSLDGKIAAADGSSRWITGKIARRFGHLLRAEADAILVGSGTVLADDPMLTCRLPGLEGRSPLRVVLDSRLQLDTASKLAQSAKKVPVLLFTAVEDTGERGAWLEARGVEIVRLRRDARGRPDLALVLAELAKRGITRLLVEGGAGVHASFLDRGVADRIALFRTGLVLGGGGRDGIDALAALSLDEAPRFRLAGRLVLGPDVLEQYVENTEE